MQQPTEKKNEMGCTPEYCVKPDIASLLKDHQEEERPSKEEISIINKALNNDSTVPTTGDKKD